MSYRLRYTPGTRYGEMFPNVRYPFVGRPPAPTLERAEQMLAAMPNADQMTIEESD